MTALGSWAGAAAALFVQTYSVRPIDIWPVREADIGFHNGFPSSRRWKRKKRVNPKRGAQAAAKRARKDGSRRRNGRFAKPSRTGVSS